MANHRSVVVVRRQRALQCAVFALIFMMLTLAAPHAWAANIEVSLDRNPVPLNESFTITFSADEEPDGDPDFSPLQADFEIIRQSQSNQFSLSNGRASRQIAWQVAVVAKKAGTLEIPAIAFGSDRSRPFPVTITYGAVRGKQGSDANIFIEMEVEPKSPYVQAQVILTIRVLSRVAFSGDLGQPQAEGALLEKLDDDREYMTQRDGVQFKVDERRYALFPQKSGPLTVGPVPLTARLGGAGGSPFNPFFRPSARTQRLHTDPVELDVRPIPTQFSGKPWLPAAKLELSDAWSQPSLKIAVGDPITRTLTLRAEGATAGVLPELGDGGLSMADVKQYPDQPVVKEEKPASGFVSTRQQKTALMAARPGTYRLPALEIPWWNTRTDRLEIARLPEQTLTVTPPAQSPAPDTALPGSQAAPAPDETAQAQPESGPAPAYPQVEDRFWFWLALLLGAGWLCTAAAWWLSRRRRNLPPATPNTRETPSERPLIRAIERACRANDPAAARQALTAWSAFRWPESPAGAMETRLGGVLGREIGLLNRSLYASSAGAWQGAALWDGFQEHVRAGKSAAQNNKGAPVLEPLYKL
jgi:hypothetical protein